MSFVPSLLQAIVRLDGEALVMHAGDKPYVVSPTGQVDLANRGLTLEAVNGVVNQLLPIALQEALQEFGAVQYELPAMPEFPGEHFTVVAARGGDDLWTEIRRRRIPDEDTVPDEFFGTTASTPPPAHAQAAPAMVAQTAAAPPPISQHAAPPPPPVWQVTPLPPVAPPVLSNSLEEARGAGLDDDLNLPNAAQLWPDRSKDEDEEGQEIEIDLDADLKIDLDDDAEEEESTPPPSWQPVPPPIAPPADAPPAPVAQMHIAPAVPVAATRIVETPATMAVAAAPSVKTEVPVVYAPAAYAAPAAGEGKPEVVAVAPPVEAAEPPAVHAPAASVEPPVVETMPEVVAVAPPVEIEEPPVVYEPAAFVPPVVEPMPEAVAVAPPVEIEEPPVLYEPAALVPPAVEPMPEVVAVAPPVEIEEPSVFYELTAYTAPTAVEPVSDPVSAAPPDEAEQPSFVYEPAAQVAPTVVEPLPEPVAAEPPVEIEEPPFVYEPAAQVEIEEPSFEYEPEADVDIEAPPFTYEPAAYAEPPAAASMDEFAVGASPSDADQPPTADASRQRIFQAMRRYGLTDSAPPPDQATSEIPASPFTDEQPPVVHAPAAFVPEPVAAEMPEAVAAAPPVEAEEPPVVHARTVYTAPPVPEPVHEIAAAAASADPVAYERTVPLQPRAVLPITRNPVRSEQPPPMVSDPTLSGLERLLRVSAARGASTLYLSSGSRPSVRVDGELHVLDAEPVHVSRDVESLLLTLMPERSHEALRTGAATEWIVDIDGVGRVRCMSFRDHLGPGGVFRLMPTRSVSADQLALPRQVQSLAIEPEGLVLVAGPRSSGKRTLMAAFVDLMNRSRRDHIITIEREINIVHERGHSFISQREVRGSDDDMVAAARAALREDPDVIVIEDLRTGPLMDVALEAAAAGRLVVGGFSAHTAAGAIDRIIDLYAPEYRRQVQLALADSLRGVIVQTLLRKIGGGRLPAREVLLNTPAVSSVIAEGKTSQLPMAIEGGRRYGMMPLNDTLVGLVQNGSVDAREAYRRSPDRPGFLAALNRQGLDTSFVERLA